MLKYVTPYVEVCSLLTLLDYDFIISQRTSQWRPVHVEYLADDSEPDISHLTEKIPKFFFICLFRFQCMIYFFVIKNW